MSPEALQDHIGAQVVGWGQSEMTTLPGGGYRHTTSGSDRLTVTVDYLPANVWRREHLGRIRSVRAPAERGRA